MMVVIFFAVLLVVICTIIHYEVLYSMSNRLARMVGKGRKRVLLSVLGAIVAHQLQIIVFSLGYYLLLGFGRYGSLEGEFSRSLLDTSYYSFVVYTSLGFGDITPVGPIRFMTNLETVTGLVMIAWTASFLFMQMQKYWNEE